MPNQHALALRSRAALFREWAKFELGFEPPAKLDYNITAEICDDAASEIDRLDDTQEASDR